MTDIPHTCRNTWSNKENHKRIPRVHVLTYSLGTQKEEREDVALSKLHQGSIDVSGMPNA